MVDGVGEAAAEEGANAMGIAGLTTAAAAGAEAWAETARVAWGGWAGAAKDAEAGFEGQAEIGATAKMGRNVVSVEGAVAADAEAATA